MRISDWSSDVCSSDLVRPDRYDGGGIIAKDIGNQRDRSRLDHCQPRPGVKEGDPARVSPVEDMIDAADMWPGAGMLDEAHRAEHLSIGKEMGRARASH